MLKFESIEIRNFLSVGNTPVTISLCDDPITLFTGNSGTGKSTVFLAISFALYGKTPRRIKKTAYANSINKKDCTTTLCWSKDGVKYKVTRGLNPAILVIEENGEVLEKSAASKDDQEWLETVFGYNYETFCQTILLSLMSYSPFLTLDAAKRREVIDNIFGLSVFTTMNSVYKRDLAEANQLVKSIEFDINKLQSNIDIIVRNIEDNKRRSERDLDTLNDNIAKTKAECINIKKEIDSIDIDENSHTELGSKIDDMKAKVKEKEDEQDAIFAKIRELDRSKPVDNSSNPDKFFNAESIQTHMKQKRKLQTNLDDLTDNLVKLQKKLTKAKSEPDNCYACGQKLSDEHIKENEEAISSLEIDIKLTEANIKQTEKNIKDASDSYDLEFKKGFEAASSEYKKAMESIKDEEESLNKEASGYTKILNKMKDEIIKVRSSFDSIESQMRKKSVLEQKLSSAVAEGKNYIGLKKKLVESMQESETERLDEVSDMKSSLETLNSNLDNAFNSQGELELIGKLLKDSGLKAIMMKQYLELTNTLMQKYIEMFGLDVRFSFNENFEETIKSRGRDDFEYFSLSSGERMRLDLAMLFTWREVLRVRTGSSVNALFFDEVFDSSLDSDGRASLIPIFDSLKSDTNIFIISHSPDHLAENDIKHIEVRKIGGFSQYNEAF